jgi:NAD(P)H-flavin reductase
MDKSYNCIDAGSKYCPCELADNLNCISCSQLQGKDYCDCNWNGVCILYEYYMNNMESKGFRDLYEGLVVDKKIIGDNLFLLKIKTDGNLITELNNIGSYVFMNKFKDKSHYNTPMSICYVDKDHIYIAYHEIGAKTRGILKGDKLGIKGPYFNGIIGREKLSNIKNSKILIVGRSIGQSSIIIPIKKLKEKNNKIYLFLDKGKANSLYALDFLQDGNLDIEEIDLFTSIGEEKLLKFLTENAIDIIFSAGSEMFHRKIKSIIDKLGIDIEWFVTNNNILCCGEGICGSCIRKINNGDRIKTCKTIINPMNFY